MIELLLKYQEVDKKLKAIEDELKKGEVYRKYEQASRFLKQVQEKRGLFEDRSAALLSAFSEAQKSLEKLNEEKAELAETVSDEADEKALAYFMRRSQEIQKKFAALESDVIKLGSDISDLVKQYNLFYKQTKAAIAQRDEYKQKYELLSKEKTPEIETVKKELAALEKQIQPEYMQKYKDKRKDGKFPIIVKVNSGFCTACGTELVIAEKEKLKKDKIIECGNCHVLIHDC